MQAHTMSVEWTRRRYDTIWSKVCGHQRFPQTFATPYFYSVSLRFLIGVESGIHEGLTTTPLKTFGMNWNADWNADCAP